MDNKLRDLILIIVNNPGWRVADLLLDEEIEYLRKIVGN